jgi:hypothetical protein
MPSAASRPVPDRRGTCDPSSTAPARSARKTRISKPQVTTMAAIDGSPKRPSQDSSGGMCSPNTTRLAGLEIGSTKLAALAMNAQANR